MATQAATTNGPDHDEVGQGQRLRGGLRAEPRSGPSSRATRRSCARRSNSSWSVSAASPRTMNIRTGLRDVRFVIFDNGKRMLFATAFETDWDPYIDDVVLVVGMPYFLDWVQHLEEGDASSPGRRRPELRSSNRATPKLDEIMKRSGAEFKQILQDQQVPGGDVRQLPGPVHHAAGHQGCARGTRPSSRCSTTPPARRRSKPPRP